MASNLSVPVPPGLVITATATATSLGTSPFAPGVFAVTPFVVTTTADNTTTPPVGSLRAAIDAANEQSGALIIFDISTEDPGYNAATGTWTIQLAGALPAITKPVAIDGTSQPGYYAQGGDQSLSAPRR